MPALIVASTGQVIAQRAEFVTTPGARMRGLLGRRLPPGTCLVLAPARQIHTFGMSKPIDVVFLDRRGRVVYLRRALPPFRITSWIPRARLVVELRRGGLPSRVVLGTQLSFSDR